MVYLVLLLYEARLPCKIKMPKCSLCSFCSTMENNEKGRRRLPFYSEQKLWVVFQLEKRMNIKEM